MNAEVRTQQRPTGTGLVEVVVLQVDGAEAEVWPGHGFNCLSWRIGGHEMLYAAPDWASNPVPTRSGIPILFPFPNRIRDGRFEWAGRTYQLPLNDSAKANAIHGFTPRRPWRVVDRGCDDRTAWVTGEFQASRDAAESRSLWPADYRLAVTYRLAGSFLRIEAVVSNSDSVVLPFGLGYHPYFAVGLGTTVQAAAERFWELKDNLPTGSRPPVDPARDLRTGRAFEEVNLDDVYTEFTGSPDPIDGLIVRGRLRSTEPAGELVVRTSPDFRELVAFTPPHRQAVCLEPYTCTTDAINLQARGIEAGWQTVTPGGDWTGVVDLCWMPG